MNLPPLNKKSAGHISVPECTFNLMKIISCLTVALCINAKAQFISTISGNGTAGYTGDGGLAVSAALHHPYKICSDASGNIYFSDCSNHRVRKIDAGGFITTIAGNGTNGYNGDLGPAIYAELSFPYGVYADKAGNIYIADIGNDCIRKVDVSGVITTIAGVGVPGYNGDGGPATSARLKGPSGVIADTLGNVFIADSENHCIRMVAANGTITTIAGTGFPGYSGDGGPATSALLYLPFDLTLDQAGNIFFTETVTNYVRKINAAGTITTVAGNGTKGYSGDGGPAINAALNVPVDVDLDGSGNIYITEQFNNCIRKVETNGIITTIAGTGNKGYSGDGGQATSADFNWLSGIAIRDDKIYVADALNQRIRMICGTTVSVSLAASDTALGCAGNPATLTVSGADNYTYTWSTAQSGSNNISVLPGDTTTYYVQGKDINGCVGSDSITLFADPCLGLEQLPGGAAMRIYPNPARFELNITGVRSGGTAGKITIRNSLGQVISTVPVFENSPGDYSVDVSDLKNGMYFISFENSCQIGTKLFIKSGH
jgi:hypothetical protein